MQNSSDSQSRLAQNSWLNVAEIVTIVGSLGGAIAALLTQQAVLASVPLSLAVSLNWFNRKQQLNDMLQLQQGVIAALQAEQIQPMAQQQADLNAWVKTLEAEQQTLVQTSQALTAKEQHLATQLKSVSEIVDADLAIRKSANPNEAHYHRGLNHEQLGNLEAAAEDFQQATLLNPQHADAFFHLGVVRLHLGNRQLAVQYLRTAAKLYLGQGDIHNYQKARDLCNETHYLNTEQPSGSEQANSSDVVPVAELFA
ncbi:tetratricopeptide repeat protein [Synechococcales cyanobacterium C]|uniref:Tetratricopeptide repeat protein n=1 Tax=Petrachloros mirabilis ULC683 TaxID=2781853 RepID=A0A8K2A967_9CYAN|nr:tetratricopeptide repeat protein [Petrachloros mirabilis]NCJ07670.1 tetratricopeptide repeat protein [Petrachloros mirabilis ULC683]